MEGAPETFVDHLGFFRAAAAIQAQKLAAAQAAHDAALAALKLARGEYLRGSTSVPGLGTLPRYIAEGIMGTPNYQAYLDNFNRAAQVKRETEAAMVRAQAGQRAANAQAAAKREADSHKNWWDRTTGAVSNAVSTVANATGAVVSGAWDVATYANSVAWNSTKWAASTAWDATTWAASTAWDADKWVATAAWDRGTTLVQYGVLAGWRRLKNIPQTVVDGASGTLFAEGSAAFFQIVGGDAELYNEGQYCGTEGECLTGGSMPPFSNADAITIGHTVTFQGERPPDKSTIKHEFQHVFDFENLGGAGFGYLYYSQLANGTVVRLVQGKDWATATDDAYHAIWTEQIAYGIQDDPTRRPRGTISAILWGNSAEN